MFFKSNSRPKVMGHCAKRCAWAPFLWRQHCSTRLHNAALPLLQFGLNWKRILTWYLLCILSYQVPKVPTSSSTTCPRSLETRTYCRCSCLSETWSLPKSSSTNRQTLASASVWHQRIQWHELPVWETHTNDCIYFFNFTVSESRSETERCVSLKLKEVNGVTIFPEIDTGIQLKLRLLKYLCVKSTQTTKNIDLSLNTGQPRRV